MTDANKRNCKYVGANEDLRIAEEVVVVEAAGVLVSAEVEDILEVAVAPDFLPILRRSKCESLQGTVKHDRGSIYVLSDRNLHGIARNLRYCYGRKIE